jgi:hypothetical protein
MENVQSIVLKLGMVNFFKKKLKRYCFSKKIKIKRFIIGSWPGFVGSIYQINQIFLLLFFLIQYSFNLESNSYVGLGFKTIVQRWEVVVGLSSGMQVSPWGCSVNNIVHRTVRILMVRQINKKKGRMSGFYKIKSI